MSIGHNILLLLSWPEAPEFRMKRTEMLTMRT
jgi:hypothetical protein